LHDDELHSLYSSPNIVRVIISKRMKWAGRVARRGDGRGVYRLLVGRSEGKNRWEVQGVGKRITLIWTLETRIDGANWIRLAQYRVR
jgi:hypothetical protein